MGIRCFSALQRAEIAEILLLQTQGKYFGSFSALQRAEIAEIIAQQGGSSMAFQRFSALQRAEIAEISRCYPNDEVLFEFQCSSTSRNC